MNRNQSRSRHWSAGKNFKVALLNIFKNLKENTVVMKSKKEKQKNVNYKNEHSRTQSTYVK